MDLAWLSLVALAVVVAISCTSRANPGVVAIVLAWGIAVCAAIALRQFIHQLPAPGSSDEDVDHWGTVRRCERSQHPVADWPPM